MMTPYHESRRSETARAHATNSPAATWNAAGKPRQSSRLEGEGGAAKLLHLEDEHRRAPLHHREQVAQPRAVVAADLHPPPRLECAPQQLLVVEALVVGVPERPPDGCRPD